MEKIKFTQAINAPVRHVYETMLGLKNKSSYEYWTAAFNPTSTYEGNWEKGSKIQFIGEDENGNKGGMVARIKENIPSEFVSVQHYGILEGDQEITSGEQVEKWAGGQENYYFKEENEITLVTVELDTIEEYQDYFKTQYPIALEKLKEISERIIK